MPTFVEKCCCRGSRPPGVVGIRHNLRPGITGALLRDRRVARFLVAPKGYGKSTCAYEYAQVVFGFRGVFWIKCDSPCFIRDLDDSTLLDQVRKADPDAKLVVFDDLPALDADRADAFEEVVRTLLDDGCEAIATCAPSVDVVSARFLDKTSIDGFGLLLGDDEVEMESLRGNLPKDEAAGLAAAKRAACLVWDEKGVERLLRGIPEEELPSELELLMFCILAIGEGDLSDLGEFVGEAKAFEDATYLASMYPYLGIDMDAGTFSSVEVPVSGMAALSKMSLSSLSKPSLQKGREDLCFAVADMLCRKGKSQRAAELLRSFSSKASAAKWVARRGWSLLSECEALPVAAMTEGARGCEGAGICSLNAKRAWACAMLDDVDEAVKASRRVLKSSTATWRETVAAAACPVSDEAPADDLAGHLAKAAVLKGSSTAANEAEARDECWMLDWGLLAELELSRSEGHETYADAFAGSVRCGEPGAVPEGEARAALLASGAWFLRERAASARRDGVASDAADAAPEVVSVASEMMRLLEARKPSSRPLWAECVATDALHAACELWPYSFDAAPSAAAMAASRAKALSLLSQSAEHRKGGAELQDQKGNYELTHENSFRPASQPASKVAALRVATPSLVLSLFGGFEAWIGSDRSESRQIRRRNAKIALAFLAMNHGREVTKEKLALSIWPNADPESARQNLYVVWAYLKKALSVGGSCPYLISTQSGYKLDSRCVVTDVEAFDDLCKGLLFGSNDKDVWEELYEKVSCDFGEDLLPEVAGNDHVDSMRARYRTQLVDGLVEAAGRMGQEGESRGAIWFAREALRRDGSREDAYIAMMEAQIASNQRAAALDTYFECRRFLSEHLGIDPSRRVVELYRSVIETEEDF